MPTKVLVVEDNPDVMFVLLSAVDSQQCEFIGVEEGTTVLDTVRRERPDLIIIDMMLPGMNGLDICRAVRKTKEYSKIKILGISGHVSAKDIDPGLFDDFLEKPFEVSLLVERMAKLLNWPAPQTLAAPHDKVLPDQNEDEAINLTWHDTSKGKRKKS